MTYSFELIYPDIKEGDSEELEDIKKHQKGMAKMAVEGSIKTIREMVQNGRIE